MELWLIAEDSMEKCSDLCPHGFVEDPNRVQSTGHRDEFVRDAEAREVRRVPSRLCERNELLGRSSDEHGRVARIEFA